MEDEVNPWDWLKDRESNRAGKEKQWPELATGGWNRLGRWNWPHRKMKRGSLRWREMREGRRRWTRETMKMRRFWRLTVEIEMGFGRCWERRKMRLDLDLNWQWNWRKRVPPTRRWERNPRRHKQQREERGIITKVRIFAQINRLELLVSTDDA